MSVSTFSQWLQSLRAGLASFLSLRVWVASPGYQLVLEKAHKYSRLVDHLESIKNPDASTMRQCLQAVDPALGFRWLGVIPVPKYDTAFAVLHEVRTRFCLALPLDQVLNWVIEDVAGELNYLESSEEVKASKELDDITTQIKHVQTLLDQKGAIPLRARLGKLAEQVSSARESRWLKVNMARSRMAVMGGLLLAVVIVGIVLLPSIVVGLSVQFFLGLALAGAAGGLVSSLLSPESVDAKAADFYLNRRMLYLRPVVGATLALASYFALQAGLLTVAGVKKDADIAGFIVVGFISGFAERFFVNKVIAPLSGAKG